MIDMVDDLLKQLRQRGLTVVYVSPTELKLTGNIKEADSTVIEAVKAFKPKLLERLKPKPPADPCPAPASRNVPGHPTNLSSTATD